MPILDQKRHAALIDRIRKLPWPEMVDEINGAIEDERKLLDSNALGALAQTFYFMLIGELDRVNSAIAQLRTKDFNLQPDTFSFELFRNKRLAETFKTYPHMVEVMKARAKVEAYNVGVKATLNLYDKIAEDPDHYIKKVATAIDEDKEVSIMVDLENDSTLGETIKAMGNYVDYFNSSICTSYFQYKAIPTKYDCSISQYRVRRKRGGKNSSTELFKVGIFDTGLFPRAETPRIASPPPRTPQAPRNTRGQHVRGDSPLETRMNTRQGASSSTDSIALKPVTVRSSSKSSASASKVQKRTKAKADIFNVPHQRS